MIKHITRKTGDGFDVKKNQFNYNKCKNNSQ